MPLSTDTAKETAKAEGRTKNDSCHGTAVDGVAEETVHHLHAVPLRATLNKAVCVVGTWELLALWDGNLEELAEWLPSHAHLVLKKILLGDCGADHVVVFGEDALAVLLEVAFPELGPEFCNASLAWCEC